MLEFGSVHTSNFSGLSNIATVVQHSQEVGGARGVALTCTVLYNVMNWHNCQFLPTTVLHQLSAIVRAMTPPKNVL